MRKENTKTPDAATGKIAIHKFLLLDGRMLKFKFGYADSNGEYYTNFADASKANNGKDVRYGAFFTVSDTDPCWEFDDIGYDCVVDKEVSSEDRVAAMLNYYLHLMKVQHGEEAAVEMLCELYKRINDENEN